MEKEIEERRAFLKEMESVGRGHEYRTIVETEVSRVSLYINKLIIKSTIITKGIIVQIFTHIFIDFISFNQFANQNVNTLYI